MVVTSYHSSTLSVVNMSGGSYNVTVPSEEIVQTSSEMPINFSQIYQLVPNTYRHIDGLLTQNVEILTIGCVIFKSREKMRVVIADCEKRHSENCWRTTPQLNNRGNGTSIVKWQKLRIHDLGRRFFNHSFDRSEFLCKFFRPGSAWTSWCASFDKKATQILGFEGYDRLGLRLVGFFDLFWVAFGSFWEEGKYFISWKVSFKH